MKIKLQIKNRFTGSLIFEYEKEDNSIKETLLEAKKHGADLSRANLYRADLSGADLSRANLYRADLSGANLSGANLYGVNLYCANLSGADLSGANLYGVNLYCANLSGADLSGANLSGANLYGANLSGADLSRADLSGANLSGANLSGANLYGVNLYCANLSGADLSGAKLYCADLSGANLSGANLSGANLYGVIGAELAIAITRICPDGDIIGWKKCSDDVIVKLLIPKDAKRNNAFGRKCRAEYAKVLEIIGAEIAYSSHTPSFSYKVGDVVRPTEPFDENFHEECSTGIHFFITRIEAEKYIL